MSRVLLVSLSIVLLLATVVLSGVVAQPPSGGGGAGGGAGGPPSGGGGAGGGGSGGGASYTNGNDCPATWDEVTSSTAAGKIKVAFSASTVSISYSACPGYPVGLNPGWNPGQSRYVCSTFTTNFPPTKRATGYDVIGAYTTKEKTTANSNAATGNKGMAINGVGIFGNQDALKRDAWEYEYWTMDEYAGHAAPTYEQHYHTLSSLGGSFPLTSEGKHSPLFGIMVDGIPIYGPYGDSGTVPTDLDECNGHVEASHPFYHYHGTANMAYPYTVNCLKGVYSSSSTCSSTSTCTADSANTNYNWTVLQQELNAASNPNYACDYIQSSTRDSSMTAYMAYTWTNATIWFVRMTIPATASQCQYYTVTPYYKTGTTATNGTAVTADVSGATALTAKEKAVFGNVHFNKAEIVSAVTSGGTKTGYVYFKVVGSCEDAKLLVTTETTYTNMVALNADGSVSGSSGGSSTGTVAAGSASSSSSSSASAPNVVQGSSSSTGSFGSTGSATYSPLLSVYQYMMIVLMLLLASSVPSLC